MFRTASGLTRLPYGLFPSLRYVPERPRTAHSPGHREGSGISQSTFGLAPT